MRIGIMLRSIDEKGGIGIYTRNITKELLELDRENEYILFYRNPANLGRFSHYENVVERVVTAPGKAAWDQIGIPMACSQEKIEVVFHPKFTVPLLAPCKTVMVLHGAGWFMPEFAHFWKKTDLKYVRALMPIYCKRASAILSVSQLTTETFNRVLKLPEHKIKTVYFAPARDFKRVKDKKILERVRSRYQLPEDFIFTLSGYERGDRKNITGIINAYKLHHGKSPHKLLVGGKDCIKFKQDLGIPDDGYGSDILFPGWIEQEDLPAIYSLADVFLYPSNVEAFPIPITEALACGTPIITSNANGLVEIVGDAAVFVNPKDPGAIATALYRVLSDAKLRKDLSAMGLWRSQVFSWDRCARETLQVFTEIMSGA